MSKITISQAKDFLFSKKNREELMNNVFIGPQGDLLEAINTHNLRYNEKLRVTKTFRWAPGTYKMIQNTVNEVLGWHKLSGVKTFKKRLDDRTWRANSYFNNIATLEEKRADLSRNGLVMSDDIEPIMEQIGYVLNTFEQMEYSSDDTFMTVQYKMPELGRNDNRYLGSLILNIVMLPRPMKVWAGKHDPVLKGEIPSYTLRMEININLATHVNMAFSKKYTPENKGKWAVPNVAGYTRNLHDAIWWGGSNDSPKGLSFPYMSERWGDSNAPMSICFGDLTSQVVAAIWNLDGEALRIYLNQWATNYNVNSTNPLRNITNMHPGRPSFYVDEHGNANDLGSIIGINQSNHDYGTECHIAPPFNKEFNVESKRYYYGDGDPEADMLIGQEELEYELDFMSKDSFCDKYCTIKDQCNVWTAFNIDNFFMREALVAEMVEIDREAKDIDGCSDENGWDPYHEGYINEYLFDPIYKSLDYLMMKRNDKLGRLDRIIESNRDRTPEEKQKAIEEAALAWVARNGGTLQQRRR